MPESEFIHSGEAKKSRVQAMFDGIAGHYDFLNHFLSFGIDVYWRRQVVRSLELQDGQLILDVATGTGDQGFAALKAARVNVVGLDFSFRMLELAKQKIDRRGLSARFELVQGDAEQLPFDDAQFDALCISYGIRNVGTISAALSEFYRVLKPGGRLVILEFAEPEGPVFGPLYRFYFDRVLPKLAGMLSSKSAYSYLPESVRHFPARRDFKDLVASEGFQGVDHRNLSFGISVLYSARK